MDTRQPKSIQDYRQERGLTQLKLANQLGVTPTTVANWERGTTVPSGEELRALVSMLDVPLHEIRLTPYDRIIEIDGHLFYTSAKRRKDGWRAAIYTWDSSQARRWPQRPVDPRYPDIQDTFSAIIGWHEWSWMATAQTPENALQALHDRVVEGVEKALYPERLPNDPPNWEPRPVPEFVRRGL